MTTKAERDEIDGKIEQAVDYLKPKTVEQIADEAGVPRAQVYRWLKTADVEKRGTRIRYPCANPWPK